MISREKYQQCHSVKVHLESIYHYSFLMKNHVLHSSSQPPCHHIIYLFETVHFRTIAEVRSFTSLKNFKIF